MDELVSKLVPPKQQAQVQLLLDDPDSRNLIRQQLSRLAEDDAGLIPQKSFSWILCKLSTFGAEEADTFRIYQAFLSQLNQREQMCRILSANDVHCKYDIRRPSPTGLRLASACSMNKRRAGINVMPRRRRNFINKWPSVVLL